MCFKPGDGSREPSPFAAAAAERTKGKRPALWAHDMRPDGVVRCHGRCYGLTGVMAAVVSGHYGVSGHYEADERKAPCPVGAHTVRPR